MDPNLTAEEICHLMLGHLTGVRMTNAKVTTTCEAWAAGWMEAGSSPEVAREVCTDLLECVAKGFPAWCGWGVEYSA